jgi:hypothetical protein
MAITTIWSRLMGLDERVARGSEDVGKIYRADLRGHPRLVQRPQFLGAQQQRAPPRGQTERIAAAVGLGLAPPDQPALLEIGDGGDKIRLLNPERRRHARLAGSRILIDEHQYRELPRP